MRSRTFICHCGLVIGASLLALLGCDRSGSQPPARRVVLYTSVDEPYLKPILAEFEATTGIRVLVQTDTEATKSAALAARLEAERDRPRADVWWGNEVFHTIRLADAGVLAPYASPAAADVPAKFKDADGHWAGAGLRARVVAIHGNPDDEAGDGNDRARVGGTGGSGDGVAPAEGLSLQDLLNPEHRGRVGIARPTAGTTGGHVAALFVLWGRQRAIQYFKQLKANNVKVLGGNGPVADAIGRGDLIIGLTDNDDVASVRRNDGSIRAMLPDQDTIGTLAIPTTVALVAGAQNPEPAKRLIDYLLSAEVERKLIEANFAGWSVREDPANTIRTMDVDYRAVARALPEAVQTAMSILEGRE